MNFVYENRIKTYKYYNFSYKLDIIGSLRVLYLLIAVNKALLKPQFVENMNNNKCLDISIKIMIHPPG